MCKCDKPCACRKHFKSKRHSKRVPDLRKRLVAAAKKLNVALP